MRSCGKMALNAPYVPSLENRKRSKVWRAVRRTNMAYHSRRGISAFDAFTIQHL